MSERMRLLLALARVPADSEAAHKLRALLKELREHVRNDDLD